ncbi:MAG: CDP-diacylglycerol--glycerol-3-phosphate 3-phosphatidyltransferase [Candidatus Cloacimonetes bacterium]|jgi:CDP-diacylglycerol--glycerol-3-phosphate 3-phosphatidyltransferase|nr:CDP-diacylglycerol--glycerol-3-phosphate 3-phosphatidyltransferase [Candidatus Cloacimonadota bacterium]
MRDLPNLLTLLRVLLIPLFLWLIFLSGVENRVAWALLVFAAASFTDWLDGFLARKWQVISDFGKIADPLADKLLVLAALAALTWLDPYRLFWLIFALIALREVLITVLREIRKKRGEIMPADKLGKLKTVLQMTGIILALAVWAWWPDVAARPGTRIAAHAWFIAVTLLTWASGLNYLKPRQAISAKEAR